MLGWKLFVRAVTLLVDNIGDALKVSGMLYLGIIVLSVWLDVPTAQDFSLDGSSFPVDGMGSAFFVSVATLIVSLWVAVAWHRYVLLDERPTGVIPTFRGSEMGAYFLWSLLIGLMIVIAIFAASIPLGLVLLIVPAGVGALVVTSGALFLGMILFYRLGILLPSIAIGKQMTVSDAWDATRGHSGTVMVLALLTVGISQALQIPAMIDGGSGLVGTVYQTVIGWIGLMLGVATLTSLYGHLVEGRPID